MKIQKLNFRPTESLVFSLLLIFSLAAAYFFYSVKITWAYAFIIAALIFLVVTLLKSDALLPLTSYGCSSVFTRYHSGPIVLGMIFFGMFMPIAFFLRLKGRDELRLKFNNKSSHWISRSKQMNRLLQTQF